MFEEGRESTHNEEHTGRSLDAKNENSVTAVCWIIKANPCATIDEIMLTLTSKHFIDIAKGAIHIILHREYELTKVCARWVPKMLTNKHKKLNGFGTNFFELL